MNNAPIQYGKIQTLLKSFLEHTTYSKIAVLVDENTKEHCLPLLPKFDFSLIEIKSGECFKNIETCSIIWNQLLHAQFDRHSLLINLGGGVITDMGGFSASCFKRGIDFINIPTTLLAMVDASVGSKTGVDFDYHKNMIGLFSEPQCIFIDDTFLETLIEKQVLSGKAEMLKHGLIASMKHFYSLLDTTTPSLALIKDSINIKSDIVRQDPFEEGLRKSLNFGHTLGHALESYYLKEGKEILHGEAVAQGMIWAIKLSVRFCGFDTSKSKDIISSLNKIYGNITLADSEIQELLAFAKNDKKNQSKGISFCLLETENHINVNMVLSNKEISRALTS